MSDGRAASDVSRDALRRGALRDDIPRREAVKHELAGLGYGALALFLGGVLASLAVAALRASGSGDADSAAVRGSFGVLGEIVGWPLLGLFGWAGAPFVPIAPAVHSLRLFGRLDRRADHHWLLFLGGLVLLAPVAAGLWGAFVAHYLAKGFGAFGAWILVVFCGSLLTAAALGWNPVRALLARGGAPIAALDDELAAAPVREMRLTKKRRGKAAALPEDLAAALEPPPEEMPAMERSLVAEVLSNVAASAVSLVDAATDAADDARAGRKGRKTKAEQKVDSDAVAATKLAAEMQAHDIAAESLAARPPKELLAEVPPHNHDVSRRELDQAALRLEEVLRTFKIDGRVTGRTVGPTVTQFEYEPAAGVKVRQIASLSDDLALAMRAPSIRIVAPIPGKGAVGIEVPNATREMVGFRELVESPDFDGAKAALPVALGKDLEGKPVIADLAKMPHLLIAGATGAGKSVCVNTIITSLVYRHTPETLRFLMVDPKMVELSVYNDLPHMKHKVITDSKDAASVLKWALYEMEDRYALLAENGCRNIQDFNRRWRQFQAGEGQPLRRPRNPDIAFEDRTYTGGSLPYVVVIIDEMADLMMTVQGEVETPIARLAQKARAIGIHLIIATQRPSVNVITGLIKANFPSRIAFRVASGVDSKTILDGVGAESLLGNGDMLFIPPGKSEPARLQGAFLSSEETERLMQWYRDAKAGTSAEARELAEGIDAAQQEEEDILELVRKREQLDAGQGPEDDAASEDRDKLFFDAAEVCIQHQGGSTSLLQRRLKIGYGRAARIIDQLHAAGVLGPPDGSKPRDVLVGPEDLVRLVGSSSARD